MQFNSSTKELVQRSRHDKFVDLSGVQAERGAAQDTYLYFAEIYSAICSANVFLSTFYHASVWLSADEAKIASKRGAKTLQAFLSWPSGVMSGTCEVIFEINTFLAAGGGYDLGNPNG